MLHRHEPKNEDRPGDDDQFQRWIDDFQGGGRAGREGEGGEGGGEFIKDNEKVLRQYCAILVQEVQKILGSQVKQTETKNIVAFILHHLANGGGIVGVESSVTLKWMAREINRWRLEG